jgi:hypothetical protein
MLSSSRLFIAVTCVLAACDLPTDATSARAALGGGADVPFTFPVPAFNVALSDYVGRAGVGFGPLVDTASLTLNLPAVTTRLAVEGPFRARSQSFSRVTLSVPRVFAASTHTVSHDLELPLPAHLTGSTTVDVRTGAIRLRIDNRARFAGRMTIDVKGTVDRNGAPIVKVLALAPGESMIAIPLDGGTIDPAGFGARVTMDVNVAAQSLPPDVAQAAFTIEPALDVEAESYEATRSYSIDDERTETLTELGALDVSAELLRDVQWSGVELVAKITNHTGAPLVIDSLLFTVPGTNGTVRLTGVRVTARGSVATRTGATRFVNALLPAIAEGGAPAVGMRLHAQAGAGRMVRGEAITVEWQLSAPLKFTLPGDGVTVRHRAHVTIDGVAAGLARSIRTAELELRLANSTPVGATITAVLAPTPADTTGFDPLTSASRIELPAVDVAARANGATQRIVIPAEGLAALSSGRISIALVIALRSSEAVTLTRADAVQVTPILHVVIGRGGAK